MQKARPVPANLDAPGLEPVDEVSRAFASASNVKPRKSRSSVIPCMCSVKARRIESCSAFCGEALVSGRIRCSRGCG